jgi:hypothetical protein
MPSNFATGSSLFSTTRPGFVGETVTTLRNVDSDRGLTWIALVLCFMTVHLTAGYGVERLFRNWARPHFAYIFNHMPQSRAEKIGYLLLSSVLQAFSIALQILTTFTLIVVFAPAEEHIRNTEFIFLGTVAAVRILATFLRAFLAVGAPSHRMVHATDAAAENVYRALLIAIIVIGIAISMCLWMEALGLNENAHKLGLIGATLISSTLFSFFALRRRADVAGMLLGGDPDSPGDMVAAFCAHMARPRGRLCDGGVLRHCRPADARYSRRIRTRDQTGNRSPRLIISLGRGSACHRTDIQLERPERARHAANRWRRRRHGRDRRQCLESDGGRRSLCA